jgi:hypothetical protein
MDAKFYNGEPEREHDPNAGGPGIAYRCSGCDWTGRGGVLAYEHHRATGHAIVSKYGIRQYFTCCAEHAHEQHVGREAI